MRVGKLAYLNSAPFYYGFEKKGWSSLEMELIPRVPSELNKMMAAGQLDISVISAFEYARQHQSYYLLPRHCVSADGIVKSVLLVSRCDIESLAGGKIAMTTSSATTQNLLKVLMAKWYHLKVDYLEMAPDLKQMLSVADACLIIGDDALRIEPWEGLRVYDFATLWKEFTGYPMVFAVVAVRKEFAHNHPLHLRQFNHELSLSLAEGLQHVDEFGEREAYQGIAKKISMRDYFSCLDYQFDSRKQESLKLYYQMAAELNLCQSCPELVFAPVGRELDDSTAVNEMEKK
jgi:chorismate dehydratase